MNDTFFSPIALYGPFINECDFFVDREGPRSERVRCDVAIETLSDRQVVEDDERYTLPHEMKLKIRLVEDGNGEERELMHALLHMVGEVSLPKQISQDMDKVERTLFVNGVSLFYSSARSYVETLTSGSSMARFTIPAIDPVAYVESLD